MVDFQNLTDEEFIIQNGFLSKDRALSLVHLAQRIDKFCEEVDYILLHEYDSVKEFVADIQYALDELDCY